MANWGLFFCSFGCIYIMWSAADGNPQLSYILCGFICIAIGVAMVARAQYLKNQETKKNRVKNRKNKNKE